jgi:hypothetical protein
MILIDNTKQNNFKSIPLQIIKIIFKPQMKKLIYVITLLTGVMQAQVGIGTTTPSGALEVNSALPLPSTQRAGLVPPIVALSATNSTATTTPTVNIINPATNGVPLTGTIVYNTNTSGAGPNQVTPGYYFYNGTLWEKLNSSTSGNWSLTGNTGTNPTTNFIGTTDNQDLRFRTNNADRVVISTDGNVGVGIVAPISRLHIFEATGTLPSPTRGTLVLDHGNNGGGSSIVFPSRVNNGSDFGYIRYDDDTSGNGSTAENALLEIGISNDVVGTFQDDIAIMPSGNLGVGTRAPKAKFHNNGTTAFTTATTDVNNTILLLNGGTFATPTANADSNGRVYIIRNTSTTNDTIVNNIINYNSATPANFTLTPTQGSIMIVCNGTNWFRID